MTDQRITWQGPVKLSRTEYYLGYLGRIEIARLDSNDIRSHWKLKLKVPGYVTDAPGGVRYSELEDGQQAAEEILGRWMKDVGMAWAPRRDQIQTWTQWGIRFQLLTECVNPMESQAEAERRLGAHPDHYTDGEVVKRQIDQVHHDWVKP